MEDIAVLIFRIVFITVLITGVVMRGKRQRPAGGNSDSEKRPANTPWKPIQQRNAAPAESVPAGAAPAPVPSVKRVVPQPAGHVNPPHKMAQSAAAQRVETDATDPDKAEAMAYEYYRKRSAGGSAPRVAKSAFQPAPHTAAETATIAADAATDNGTDIVERFNLRDAVLYSEILRPKFDE